MSQIRSTQRRAAGRPHTPPQGSRVHVLSPTPLLEAGPAIPVQDQDQDQDRLLAWNPHPRECAATVLFADLRGYTSLAEHHAPRQVLALLNACFAVLVRCLEDESAYLDKFLGDGLMAVFGLHDGAADHPLQAVRAGVAMQQAFHRLAEDLRCEGWQDPGLGVGIDSGPIVAGSIGIPSNSQFTVIGDVVNVASRLTAGAQAGEVVVGPGAGTALLKRVALESLGVIPIRGRSSPVSAWRLQPAAFTLLRSS